MSETNLDEVLTGVMAALRTMGYTLKQTQLTTDGTDGIHLIYVVESTGFRFIVTLSPMPPEL